MQRMIGRTEAGAALAVLLLLATGGSAVAQEFAGREVKGEVRETLRRAGRAIIYTHSHPDYSGGSTVLAGNDRFEIYSHQLLVDRVPDVGRAGRDGGDQFGASLPDSLRLPGRFAPFTPIMPAGSTATRPISSRYPRTTGRSESSSWPGGETRCC